MTELNKMYYIAKADFLERSRQFSYIVLIGIAILAAYFAVPNPNAMLSSIVINPNDFAQITNGSWIPISAALCSGLFFAFVGVIYVKNAFGIDRKSGVMDLVQCSSINKFTFVAGKFLSNFLLLFIILMVIAGGSVIMIMIKFPGYIMPIKTFLTPFLSIIPNLIFCSAIAILLELFPAFKSSIGGTLGTVFLFALVITSLSFAVILPQNHFVKLFDFTGYSWIWNSINSVISTLGKTVELLVLVGGSALFNNSNLPDLVLEGVKMQETFIWGKLILFAISLLVVYLSSFSLFTREKKNKIRNKTKKSRQLENSPIIVRIKPQIFYDFKMKTRPLSSLWFLVFVGLWLILMFLPIKISQTTLYPIMCAWCIVLFSDIGYREYESGVENILSVMGEKFIKQLVWEWFLGFICAIIMTIPLLWRLALRGQWNSILVYISFTVFIPALGTLLGEYSKSKRPFEISFIAICYILLNAPSLLVSATFMKAILLVLISILFLYISCTKRYLQVGFKN